MGDATTQLEHYDALVATIARVANEDRARQLLGRTLRWARSGKLDELLELCVAAATEVLGDPPLGKQTGVLLAGAATLLHDHVPSKEELEEWMAGLGLEYALGLADPGGKQLLERIFRIRERVGTTKEPYRVMSVGELVAIAIADQPKARKHLTRIGIRVEDAHLLFATRSPWIRRHAGVARWPKLLKTMPGARSSGDHQLWFGGLNLNSRYVRVPLARVAGLLPGGRPTGMSPRPPGRAA